MKQSLKSSLQKMILERGYRPRKNEERYFGLTEMDRMKKEQLMKYAESLVHPKFRKSHVTLPPAFAPKKEIANRKASFRWPLYDAPKGTSPSDKRIT